ncbi:GNAT family N-acetyltransferase [Pseudoalteromonas ulvae]|uniref:Ribosomal protein acetyltransferase n=1 Tax=Pseudoalteromonas ulvae TaxID=107327 RepID=A0A244CM79_PSEDV|nr:GNAT family N-acetyltransferase [Pseudoalteromonas ulvae]OUL56658.1 ribosomal protein acetyltransferase [Pseudoalteromonas ulvae]
MVFEKLAKHHASQLLDFELDNKQWFETLIEPRAKSFYSIKGVTEHIDLLNVQMDNGTGYSGVLLQDNIIVARANIKDISNNEAFVGYRVAKAFTGKGVASFCLSQLINIAQSKFNITELKALVLENNPASMHVLRKFGFEATSRNVNTKTLNGKQLSCIEFFAKYS